MRPRTSVLIVGITLLVGNSCTGEARRGRCETCLTLTPVVELNSSAGDFMPSMVQSVLRMGDGRFLVSHLFAGKPQLAVYDGAGQFLQLYGKQGHGPGELHGGPSHLYAGRGNTVLIFNYDRLLRLDGSLQHIDTRTLSGQLGGLWAFALSNGSIVVDSNEPAPGGGFYAVSIIDSTGTATRRLEPGPELERTVIAPATGEGFWAIRTKSLLLRRYSNSGELVQSFQLVSDYFQPWQTDTTDRSAGPSDSPPRPEHVGLIDMGNDQIVLITTVASAEWTPIARKGPGEPLVRLQEMDYNKLYDAMVGLVDLRTQRTVTSTRVTGPLLVVNGARGLVFGTRQDSSGHVTTSILRLQVQRP